MKTKELVKRFIESEDKESELHEIIKGLGTELQELQKARNIKTDAGLIPIFKDMDAKYKSFVFKVNSHYGKPVLKQNLFSIWLKTVFPLAYNYYINNGH